MGVEPNIGGFVYPPKWMVKIMVPNPMNKWMIWGYHYFRKHPYVACNIPLGCDKQSLLNTSLGLALKLMNI